MFLRHIEDINRFFKAIDRLNAWVFNVWNDQKSDAFKNVTMLPIEDLYRRYISEMRQLSNELLTLQKQIAEGQEEIYQLEREIAELKRQPEIEGCYSAYYVDKNGYQISSLFAVSKKRVHDIVANNVAGIHLDDRL